MIKKGDSRGLSPTMATVLLIGLVILIALIVFLWLRGLSQEAVIKFDKNAELVCDEVNFEASYSSGTLGVSNTGNVPIYNLKVKMSEGGSFKTSELNQVSEDWPEFGLSRGSTFSDELNIGNSNKLTLVPILLGNSKSGKEKTLDCDDSKYGYEILL
ncbi:hypothetical protein J4407_02335 [Candidatus Pacearchaeota archaeon]|nr:hypothetical protein [Candidatus Pacearchaeota archaeon]